MGPVLFYLYINNIENYIKHCNVMLFADGTMLYCVGTNLGKMVDNVNRDFINPVDSPFWIRLCVVLCNLLRNAIFKSVFWIRCVL